MMDGTNDTPEGLLENARLLMQGGAEERASAETMLRGLEDRHAGTAHAVQARTLLNEIRARDRMNQTPPPHLLPRLAHLTGTLAGLTDIDDGRWDEVIESLAEPSIADYAEDLTGRAVDRLLRQCPAAAETDIARLLRARTRITNMAYVRRNRKLDDAADGLARRTHDLWCDLLEEQTNAADWASKLDAARAARRELDSLENALGGAANTPRVEKLRTGLEQIIGLLAGLALGEREVEEANSGGWSDIHGLVGALDGLRGRMAQASLAGPLRTRLDALIERRSREVDDFLAVTASACTTLDEARDFQKQFSLLPSAWQAHENDDWYKTLNETYLSQTRTAARVSGAREQLLELMRRIDKDGEHLPRPMARMLKGLRSAVDMTLGLWERCDNGILLSETEEAPDAGGIPVPQGLQARLQTGIAARKVVDQVLADPAPSPDVRDRFRDVARQYPNDPVVREAEAHLALNEFIRIADEQLRTWSIDDFVAQCREHMSLLHGSEAIPYGTLSLNAQTLQALARLHDYPPITDMRAGRTWYTSWTDIIAHNKTVLKTVPMAFRDAIDAEEKRRLDQWTAVLDSDLKAAPDARACHEVSTALKDFKHPRLRLRRNAFERRALHLDVETALSEKKWPKAQTMIGKIAALDEETRVVDRLRLLLLLDQARATGGMEPARVLLQHWPEVRHHLPDQAPTRLLETIEAAWEAHAADQLQRLSSLATPAIIEEAGEATGQRLTTWKWWLDLEPRLFTPDLSAVRELSKLYFRCGSRPSLHRQMERLIRHWRDTGNLVMQSWANIALAADLPSLASTCADAQETLTRNSVTVAKDVHRSLADNPAVTRSHVQAARAAIFALRQPWDDLRAYLLAIPPPPPLPEQPAVIDQELAWVDAIGAIVDTVEMLEDADLRQLSLRAKWRQVWASFDQRDLELKLVIGLRQRLETLNPLFELHNLYPGFATVLDRLGTPDTLDEHGLHDRAIAHAEKMIGLLEKADMRGRRFWRAVSADVQRLLADADSSIDRSAEFDLALTPNLLRRMSDEDRQMYETILALEAMVEPGFSPSSGRSSQDDFFRALPMTEPSTRRARLRFTRFRDRDRIAAVLRRPDERLPRWLQSLHNIA
ncbi:MAG: hypothetical protein H7840_16365 [Alphaproteobacteria bacterium]